jgi:predicted transcriptional regulator
MVNISDKKVRAIRELWQEGFSEAKIAKQLHTTRRQVIGSLKDIKTKNNKEQHTIANLYLQGKKEADIFRIAKRRGIKKPKIIKKKIPKKTLEINKEKKKGYYKRMQDRIKTWEEKNFRYYIFGVYKLKEKYPMQNKEGFFNIGIKSGTDFERFLEYKHKLKSYRAYDSDGIRVSIKLIAQEMHYNIKAYEQRDDY